MCLSPEGRGVWLFPAHQAGIDVYNHALEIVAVGHGCNVIFMGEAFGFELQVIMPVRAAWDTGNEHFEGLPFTM